jgi:ferric-dicitrate binding protein FerR (iron transport regulator)
MPEAEQAEPPHAARRRQAAARRRRRRRLGVAAVAVGLIGAAAVGAFLLLSDEQAGPAPSPSIRQPASAAPAPARVYTWPATDGASFYDVRLLLNGISYYRVRTDEPRLEFPAGVQLAPGLYVLRVRPGFVGEQGITFGEAIPDRRFQIDG